MGKTTDRTSTRSRDDWIRFAFTLGFNLPFWALMLWATMTIGRTESVQSVGSATRFAVIVGILHVSFGLTAAAQRASAQFIRAASEAEEFRREGRALLLAAGALVAAGSSMILLGVAGPERLVPPAAGAEASRAPDALSRRVCTGERGSCAGRAQDARGCCRQSGRVQRAIGHRPATLPEP